MLDRRRRPAPLSVPHVAMAIRSPVDASGRCPVGVAPPDGARIRTRLRRSAGDEAVVRAVGEQLGCLAGGDLAARCRLGAGDDQRADRKRTLTPVSSSPWAGAIPR